MFCIVNSRNIIIEGGFFSEDAAEEACRGHNQVEADCEANADHEYVCNYGRVVPQIDGKPDVHDCDEDDYEDWDDKDNEDDWR